MPKKNHMLAQLDLQLAGHDDIKLLATVGSQMDGLIFLRRIVKGGADDSYGIEVSALAGLPKEVVSRAKEILAQIDKKETAAPDVKIASAEPEELQIGFSDLSAQAIKNALTDLDVTTLTPIEAMNKLYELVKLANES